MKHPAPHPHRQAWRARLATAFAERTRTYRSRALGWRLVAPAVFLVAGVLFVTSMVSSEGRDIRAGRYDDLDGLANAQAKDLEAQRTRAADLTREVDRLTRDLGTVGGEADRAKVRRLEGPAGLSPVHGPGVTITLDDAPKEKLAAAGTDLSAVSELLVHQQDIQAVANALWAGGAEAMTLMGQRVISTSAVRCVGNTLILQGRVYSPPFVITGMGNPAAMRSALDASPQVQIYKQYVDAIGLGYEVRTSPERTFPAYAGSVNLQYASVPK